jgi:ribosomal protein L1
MSRGKKYTASVSGFDRQHLYAPAEAVDLVKASAKASFDETVELAVRLGVDPRKADQIVRGTLSRRLPRRGPPVPMSWVPTISWPGWPKRASSTSTSPSPPRT